MPAGRFIERILIDVTTKCNLRCIMCAVSDEKEKYDMSAALFEKIASQSFPHAKELWLSCGYESLAARDFIPMMRSLGKYGVPSTTLITNGTLLNENNIAAMLASGLRQVLISFDGATPETFQAIRRGADFDRVLSNISLLMRLKEESGSQEPEVILTTTLMQRNMREFPGIVDLAGRLGLRRVWCKPMRVAFPWLEAESIHAREDCLAEILNEAEGTARAQGITIGLSPELEQCISRRDGPVVQYDNARGRERKYRCREYPFPIMVIRASGKVYPCSIWKGMPVGDFSTDDFEAIWNNAVYSGLREDTASGRFEGECWKCVSNDLLESYHV